MRALLAIPVVILAGCAHEPAPSGMPSTTIKQVCVPVSAVSGADQDRLRTEYDALPATSMLKFVVKDWLSQRAADRACAKAQE